MFCVECGKEIVSESDYCINCGANQNVDEQKTDKTAHVTNLPSKKSPRVEVVLKYILLFAIAIGIWALVLQNSGFIPTSQNVYVEGGNIEASVEGDVAIINSVNVTGSIRVINEVDVNLSSINGYSNAFYALNGSAQYDAIQVFSRY